LKIFSANATRSAPQQAIIAKRVALELRPGNLINLGIGMQDDDLFAEHPPNDEQRFDQNG
jgi:acyl CoA:acetate/3-ketoacid CoA transferase